MFMCFEAMDCLCPPDRPSPIYMISTCLQNAGVAVIAITNFVASDSSGTCTNPMLKIWYIIMFVICGLNMMFSIYLHLRLTSKIRSGETLIKAVARLLIYDFGVYFYVWVVVFTFVWLAMSFVWRRDERVCISLANTTAVTALMYLYLGVGGFLFAVTIITECGRAPKWTAARPTSPQDSHSQPMLGYQPRPVQQGYPAGNQNPAHPAPNWCQAPPAVNPIIIATTMGIR
jgi:hypothetical protein